MDAAFLALSDGVAGLGEFHDLHDRLGGVSSGEDHSVGLEALDVAWLDLVAMAEAFADGGASTEEERGERSGEDLDVLSAEAHGPA